MSNSRAVTKRSADSELMPPPPPPKRVQRPPVVLDEQTYADALSHIIVRDFYPGLLEARAQQDYLDAIDSNDREWIQEAESNVRAAMTPAGRSGGLRRASSATPGRGVGGETPRDWTGETPASKRSDATSSRGTSAAASGTAPHVDLSLSLTAFQAKYTSEDNESFHKLSDQQNANKREKNPWLYTGNKLPSKQQIAQAAQHQRLLHSSSSQGDARPSQDPDQRAPLVAFKPPPRTPHNALMFHPHGIAESHPDLTSTAQEAQDSARAPPRSVNHDATRFMQPSTTETPVPASPSLSAIDAAIAGRRRHRADSTVAGSDAPGSNETPRVSGYTYVDAEPTRSELAGINDTTASGAAADAEHDEHERRAAVLALMRGSGSGGPNPFTIADASRREALHHRLVDRNAAAKRAPAAGHANALQQHLQQQRGGKAPAPTPRFASGPQVNIARTRSGQGSGGGGRREATMTPAAQALYARVGGRTPGFGGGSAAAFDEAAAGSRGARGKGSFTPTPLRVRKPGT